MIQKFITKYGLSTHLAMLAALPLSLSPFLSASALATVILWLSVFGMIWLFAAPTMLAGEHLFVSRARVRAGLVRDPLFYFFVLLIACAIVRWLNTGASLFYDVEQTAWRVKEPAWSALPAAVTDAGILPLAVTVGVSVVVMGLRHGMGLGARISFGVVASFLTGLGGLAAAICACCACAPFPALAAAGFDKGPFGALVYGTWLCVGMASAMAAEARQWRAVRLPFSVMVCGNAVGLYFFAPPYVSLAWGVLAILATFWGLSYLGRVGSMASVARSLVFLVLGVGTAAFFVASFAPETVKVAKMQGIDSAFAWTEAMQQCSDALSRIGREMWMQQPWTGVGVGAFGLHVPFLAETADWAVLPQKPAFAWNSYWTLLAERGIVGTLLLVVALGMMVWTYVSRLIAAYLYLRTADDADVFMFAVPPVAWVVPFTFALWLLESIWIPDFSLGAWAFAVLPPLALGAASFPRRKRAKTRMAAASAVLEK